MCCFSYRSFTTYSGVNKIKVIHTTYPQAVHNNDEKMCFDGKRWSFPRFLEQKHLFGKRWSFPRFLEQKHLFSVDNPVHTVYKQELNKNS